MTQSCYACEKVATTREHVPPFSFFPEGFRDDLVTVPSCAEHNLNNSKDVEYVRNVIVFLSGTNLVAEKVFPKARRSFDRSDRLFKRTFADFKTVRLQEKEKGVFSIDLDRLAAVIEAIARAIHYNDYNEKLSTWRIFSPTLDTEKSLQQKPDNWDSFRKLVTEATFETRQTPHPKVYSYGAHEMDKGVLYKFVFYEGFVVNAWPVLD